MNSGYYDNQWLYASHSDNNQLLPTIFAMQLNWEECNRALSCSFTSLPPSMSIYATLVNPLSQALWSAVHPSPSFVCPLPPQVWPVSYVGISTVLFISCICHPLTLGRPWLPIQCFLRACSNCEPVCHDNYHKWLHRSASGQCLDPPNADDIMCLMKPLWNVYMCVWLCR